MINFNIPEKRKIELVPDFVKQLPSDGNGNLAIFDADGTIWCNDVADDFTTWMIDNNHISGDDWNKYLEIYRDNHALGCQFLLTLYKGLHYKQLDELAWQWWKNYSDRNWIMPVLESLYLLADRKYTIWVVTGSPTPPIAPITNFLPVNKVLGMDFKQDANGIITGELDGISCTDEGKAKKVNAFLEKNARILFAAGNGSLDAAMMKISKGVIWSVYPNDAFLKYSKLNKWHILPRPKDFVEEVKLA